LPQLESLFVQVLLLDREMKLMKLGRVAPDGTKANASKHKALSYMHAKKIEAQLKAEVSALTAQAEAGSRSIAGSGWHGHSCGDCPARNPVQSAGIGQREN